MSREIRHSFQTQASPEAIVAALLEPARIREWWTRESRGEADRLVLGWSDYGWEVTLAPEVEPSGRRVVWNCLKSNMQDTDAWEGTTIAFALVPEAGGTHVEFVHSGYRDSPCFEACARGWGFFVGTSLKQYLETGKGIPYPETC